MRPALLLRACAFLLILGCARTRLSPTSGPPRPDSVETVSGRLQALLRTQDDQVWQAWTKGARVELAKTYEGLGALFTQPNLDRIVRERDAALARPGAEAEARALTALHVHFVGEMLSRAVTAESDALAELEATLTFSVDSEEHPYGDLARLLANEPSAKNRRALYAAAGQLTERLTPLVRQRDEKLKQTIPSLGFPTLKAYFEASRGFDTAEAVALAKDFLQKSQPLFTRVLAQTARRNLGIPAGDLRVADLPRLFRPPATDTFFPAEALVPRTRSLVEGMGLEWSRLKVDVETSQVKSPRPLAIAVEIPNDVRLSLNPTGGLREQVLALQETAYALYAASIQQRRFGLSKLGPPLLGKLSGELFANLGTQAQWLESASGLSAELAAPVVKSAALYDLFLLRRSCARVLFAEALAGTPGPEEAEVKSRYRALFSQAYGFELNDDEVSRAFLETYPLDVAVDALRSSLAAEALARFLQERHGVAWWSTPGKEAGSFLKTLWAEGTSLPPQQLPSRWGAARLAPEAKLQRLEAALKPQ